MTEEKTEEVKEEVKNIVTIEEVGPCRKKVTIEVPVEAIKEIIAGQYKDLRKEAVLPGFRKGRTPQRLLEKKFGKDINEQTKLKLLADATEKALAENKIDALGEPNINHEDFKMETGKPFNFSFEVNVRPDFELPALDAIKIEKPNVEVSDEQVDERIASIVQNFGVMTDREAGAAVEAGDTVVADVVVTPEGGEAVTVENTDIIVNEGGFCAKVPVADLTDQLVGAKTGDEKSFSTTVGEKFFNKDFAGKKCDIKVTVKNIRYRKPAELNEDLFDKLGLEDLDALKDRIRDILEDENERKANADMADTIRKYLLDNTSFDMPQDIIAEQAESTMKRQYSRLLMEGLDAQELQRRAEELQTASQEEAQTTFKSFFIMDKVAQKLEVEVSEEEINGYISQIAMYRGSRPEKIRGELLRDGSLTQFTMQAREQKCIEKIIEMNLPKDGNEAADSDDNTAENPKPKKPKAKKSDAAE